MTDAARLRYLSVCSGIEAATVAWHPLGWEPAAFSEIEAFPRAVLAHHYPDVPNWGDMTKFKEWPDADVDVLVGGTPCQSFSVAGLRKGMDDPRGNLALTYLAIAARYRPQWLVWENVPGVLSSNGGRDFGSILGGMVELGYGIAYRVLDAQYFRVPQRRRRVFVVGYLGDWRRAAAVLFERESLLGNPPPRREAGEGLASAIDDGPVGSLCADTHPGAYSGQDAYTHPGAYSGQDAYTGRLIPHAPPTYAFKSGQSEAAGGTFVTEGYAPTLQAANNGSTAVPAICFSVKDYGADAGPLSPTLRSGGHDKSHANGGVMPAVAYQTPVVSFQANTNGDDGIEVDGITGTLKSERMPAVAFQSSQSGVRVDDVHATFDSNNGSRRHNGVLQPVAFDLRGREEGSQFERPHDTANIRAASGGSSRSYVAAMQVRRLTPMECERLQGFPDNFTLVPYRGKPASDGPRYKALGNSMAVPVMAWIGQRIAMLEALT